MTSFSPPIETCSQCKLKCPAVCASAQCGRRALVLSAIFCGILTERRQRIRGLDAGGTIGPLCIMARRSGASSSLSHAEACPLARKTATPFTLLTLSIGMATARTYSR